MKEVPKYWFRKYLCSAGEYRFYRALVEAVGGEYDVMMKVRVAAILSCDPDRWETDGRRVSQKEFDFVLVRKSSSCVVAAVELDDRSHRARQRRVRDEFLNSACERAGLPLLRVAVCRAYDCGDLRARVERLLVQA